jgi:hypothetical protein
MLEAARSFVCRFTSPPPAAPLESYIRQASDGIRREAALERTNAALANEVLMHRAREADRIRTERENDAELYEMSMMRGTGPWRMPEADRLRNDPKSTPLQLGESTSPFVAQGAYGDTELMLQNIDWRRETNLSWLEFTRWGIQQVILIARLRAVKDPMLNRGINICAQYVFSGDVEITSDDPDAADILKDWRDRNKRTLGHAALADQERLKYTDGNIFWVCFTDEADTGEVNVRTLDALEILDIVCDPDDSSVPWFYRREWIAKVLNPTDGTLQVKATKAWYPALNFNPEDYPEIFAGDRPEVWNGVPILWTARVYHRKCSIVPTWHFGLPQIYPMLGMAKAVQRFLEDCMTINNSLAQFSLLLTTKGGQQALQGAKTQLSTTVGPNASLWDQNPTAVAGAIFAGGPGTELKAFETKGAGFDPGKVREYKLQVAMGFGLPESWFADMETSSLATAESLDRCTELNFREKQEIWDEDICALGDYQLRVSLGAPSGKLREAKAKKAITAPPKTKTKFPAIVEADIPQQVGAVVNAMTLGNTQGQVIGIDEKAGVSQLYTLLGIDAAELIEDQYPETGPDAYDPVRKDEQEPEPGTEPGAPGAPPVKPTAKAVKEAMARVMVMLKLMELKSDN